MALIQYTNEYKKLKRVIMYRPTVDEIEQNDVVKAMYVAKPSPLKVIEEVEHIAHTLQSFGIEVILLESKPSMTVTPNMIFVRDLGFVFRDQLVIARPRHHIRQDEPRILMTLLASQYPEILNHIVELPAYVYMEGADLLVQNSHEISIYTDNRTNTSAINALQEAFSDVSVQQLDAQLFNVPQHILGGLHIVDETTAMRRNELGVGSVGGVTTYIDFPEDDEMTLGFGLNVVTLGPKDILMPAGNPHTKEILNKHGITCHEIQLTEIHKMGGGLACTVLPLWREN